MKKLLVVVDYQNDFVDGALGFPGAELLDERICAKITRHRADGQTVVFTYDTHGPEYLSTQEGERLPTPHCEKGSVGWELYGKTAETIRPEDHKFLKPSFGSMELGDYIRSESFDEIELLGLVSNMCVLSNAVIAKAASPESRIVIDAACTASFDDELNSKALDVMAALQMDVLR